MSRTGKAPGVAAAWRSPGQPFGPYAAVSRSAGAMMIDPMTVFDGGSAAHVYGTVGCGRLISTCATMVSTGPRSRRFGAPLVIAPAPAEFPVVSFSAPGRALIAWEAADFEGLEPSFAAPYARVMIGGALSAPVSLQAGPGSVLGRVTAVAATTAGGTVAWTQGATPPFSSPAHTMLVTGDASGRFSAPSVSPTGMAPALRDGIGDVLLTLGGPGFPAPGAPGDGAAPPSSPVTMQPAGGGPAQPSPVPMSSAPFAAVATTQPLGAGAAAAWVTGGRLLVSTWRR